VTFAIEHGEVLALVGENGAGKSTLVKILSGIYRPDSGVVSLNGVETHLASAHDAQMRGITTIFQETTLIPDFDAMENIFLGRELRMKLGRTRGPFLAEREMRDAVRILYRDFVSDEADLDRPVREIGALRQKVVEVLRGLAFESSVVIMDEPTAPLSDRERNALFVSIRALKARGVAVLLVTHRLEELLEIADRAVVLRDGRYIASVDPREAGIPRLVHLMVGRDVDSVVPSAAMTEQTYPEEAVLAVNNLQRRGVLRDITFNLKGGEILGVAGMAGSGNSELARALVGMDRIDSGEILRDGRPVRIRSPKDAIRHGIALVPEERKTQGIFGGLSVAKNISAAALRYVTRGRCVIDERRERAIAEDYVSRLHIRPPDVTREMRHLSGGNQQKALIARYLLAGSQILVVSEPTQGIDVGAKSDVYGLIFDHVNSGGAAIVVSSELNDLTRVSDRILVIRDGGVAGEVRGGRGRQLSHGDYGVLEEAVLRLAVAAA